MHSTFAVQNYPPKIACNFPAAFINNISKEEGVEIFTINAASSESIELAGTSDEDSTYLDTSQFIIEGLSYVSNSTLDADDQHADATPLQSMDNPSQKKQHIGAPTTKRTKSSGPNIITSLFATPPRQSSSHTKQVKKPRILEAQPSFVNAVPATSGEYSVSKKLPEKKTLRFSKVATILGEWPSQTERVRFKSPDRTCALSKPYIPEEDYEAPVIREKVKRKLSNEPMTKSKSKHKPEKIGLPAGSEVPAMTDPKPKPKKIGLPGCSDSHKSSTAVKNTPKPSLEKVNIQLKRKTTLNPKYFGPIHVSKSKRIEDSAEVGKHNKKSQDLKTKLPIKKRETKPNPMYFGPQYVSGIKYELDNCDTKPNIKKENELPKRNKCNKKYFNLQFESSDHETHDKRNKNWDETELPKRASKPNPTFFGPDSPFKVARPAYPHVLNLQTRDAVMIDVMEGALNKRQVAKKHEISLWNLKDIVKSYQTYLGNYLK